MQPLSLLLFGLVLHLAQPVSAEPRVLVFSKTAGFRHDSIADGVGG